MNNMLKKHTDYYGLLGVEEIHTSCQPCPKSCQEVFKACTCKKAIAAARLRSKLLQIRRQAYGDNDLLRTGFRHHPAEGTSSPEEPTSFDGQRISEAQ
eukprot:6469641-Amphidinium_carterae.1